MVSPTDFAEKGYNLLPEIERIFESKEDLLPFRSAISDFLRVLSLSELVFIKRLGLDANTLYSAILGLGNSVILDYNNGLFNSRILQICIPGTEDRNIFIPEATSFHMEMGRGFAETDSFMFINGSEGSSQHFVMKSRTTSLEMPPVTGLLVDFDPQQTGWLNT